MDMTEGGRMEFVWKAFADLSADELYDLLAFRQDVFIVEQASPYQDLDGKDRTCDHLIVRDREGRLAGYARVRGAMDGEPAFAGRFVVAPAHRGTGLGRRLVAEALRRMAANHPGQDIEIGAQAHLQRFYEGFGFVREGDMYDDGGIPHVIMWLRHPAAVYP